MTDVNEISAMVERYGSWLKEKMHLKPVHTDWVEFRRPSSIDATIISSCMQKKRTGPSSSLMTGTRSEIWKCPVGCKLDTPKRQSLLKVTLNGFGVEEKNGILSVHAKVDNFAVRKHAIIQSILALSTTCFIWQVRRSIVCSRRTWRSGSNNPRCDFSPMSNSSARAICALFRLREITVATSLPRTEHSRDRQSEQRYCALVHHGVDGDRRAATGGCTRSSVSQRMNERLGHPCWTRSGNTR